MGKLVAGMAILLVSLSVAWAQMGRVPEGWKPNATPTLEVSSVSVGVPRIKFLKVTHDFGDVEEGAPVTHTYRFRNTGRSPLRIGDVRASCGCAAAAATTREIPPGGAGSIRAVYQTQGRPGRAMKNVTVDSNDPRSPTLSLSFNVNVVREIDVQPDRLYFFGVRRGQSRSTTITVLGKPGQILRVDEVEIRDNIVRVTQAPLTQIDTSSPQGARTGCVLVVDLPDTIPIGEVSDELILRTNHPKKPEVRIPVNGEVVGRVQAFPKSIHMGDLRQPQTIMLSADPPEGFVIRNVTTEKGLVGPWVRREVPASGGGGAYRLVLTPPDPRRLAPGDYDDTVILWTNDSDQRVMRLPVRGIRSAE